MFCAKFGWNWPSGSGEEDENVKSLRRRQQRQQRRTTDKLWSEKLTWAFGSGELKISCFPLKISVVFPCSELKIMAGMKDPTVLNCIIIFILKRPNSTTV